jgi:K+ transporter
LTQLSGATLFFVVLAVSCFMFYVLCFTAFPGGPKTLFALTFGSNFIFCSFSFLATQRPKLRDGGWAKIHPLTQMAVAEPTFNLSQD